MARVKLVTGFIPVPCNPRPVPEYMKLGEQLADCWDEIDVHGHEKTPEDTFLWNWLGSQRSKVTHSAGDNPAKNSLAYHCVQHEKFNWLLQSSLDTDADMLAWIDFGILHVPGVTVEVIRSYLSRVANFGCVSIPGCWGKQAKISSDYPCWRFCGGLILVPTAMVKRFASLMYFAMSTQIMDTNNVEWEVNTLARMELTGELPILWYEADHNETMFTNYK